MPSSSFSNRFAPAFASVVLLLAGVLAPTANASGAPDADQASGAKTFDYLANPGLSKPVYETERKAYRVPMHDGILLYVEVVRPIAEGRYPVILELSPYHGTNEDRNGTTTLPFPLEEEGDARTSLGLTGYFAPRGYAVAIADLRGTGRSQGCLDHLGPNDAKDARDIVEWLASQPWSNGRVGMAGFSYVAASQVLTAAQKPKGLVTIVPDAGLGSMYDHQFQAGVPYSLQWAGPQWFYVALSVARHLPPAVSGLTGDNFGNDMQYFGCGAASSALVSPGDSQLSGEYTSWHGKRDFREKAEDAPIPIFLVHGINDGAARIAAADWFFERDLAEYGDKLWLGQWHHFVPRGMQFTRALHAWFDHHLQQRTWTDADGVQHQIDTGPPVEVFLADAEKLEPARFGGRTEVFADQGWPRPSRTATLSPAADGSLRDSSPPAGEVSFVGDPRDTGTGDVLDPDYDESTAATGHVEFVSEPSSAKRFFLGRPELLLTTSVSVPRVHVIATVYDQSPSGARRRITTCAINPELRHGVAAPEPVVPLLPMDLEPPCFVMAHVLRTGHKIVLRVTTSNKDKVALFGTDAHVSVFAGPGKSSLRLPEILGAQVTPDTVPVPFE